MFVYSFERLEVWRLSMDLTAEVYAVTNKFPFREQYGLSHQVRRAAVSVSSNLAEGSGRTSKKDQAHFFSMAYSSLMEVLNQLILSRRIGYVDEIELASLRSAIETLSKKIAALRKTALNPKPSTLYPLLLKIENHPIDTITQSRRGRTIIKYMSQMRFAATTLHFRAGHAVGVIRSIYNISFANRFIETGPSASAVEFRIAFEQRIATSCAVVCAHLFVLFKWTGPRTLRSLQTRDIKHIGR